ncbi:anti-anti-sigma factor, partial [Mycobacterium tuberculosis]
MSAPDSITVTVADHNGVAVLSIGGEIDLITAAALEEAIGEVVADNPT